MNKGSVALAAALLLSGTAVALAADWPAFKNLDTDSNGQIDRVEYQKNIGKAKIEYAPNFAAMDDDNNNGVDENEWAAAEKLTKSYTARCREASASWCKDAKVRLALDTCIRTRSPDEMFRVSSGRQVRQLSAGSMHCADADTEFRFPDTVNFRSHRWR